MNDFVDITEPLEVAKKWLEADPDKNTRTETAELIENADGDLIARFSERLEFGTAGIRGPRGAGPMRMNRVMIRVVAKAIASQLLNIKKEKSPLLAIVGFDSRHQSQIFAEDTVRVFASFGIKSLILPRPLPTPLLAHASLDLRADVGIMVTASHNPAADSGYKVYWSDGAQIASPVDIEISEKIDYKNPPAKEELADFSDPLICRTNEEPVEKYVKFATQTVSFNKSKSLSVVYTPIHGVGRDVFLEVFEKAGFEDLHVVEEQAEPDPDFPTVSFPNPEEKGVLDLAINLAEKMTSDLVIANDPDADRLAVALPHYQKWRVLTGNEIGALLAEHILKNGSGKERLVVTTIVSSRLLSEQAKFYGVKYVETLTGFKWIVRPGIEDDSLRFVFGFEEALGFAVRDSVLDKDGITSALLFADLVAELKNKGRDVFDLLDDLWKRHGVHKTALSTYRLDNSQNSDLSVLDFLRKQPLFEIAEQELLGVVDLNKPGSGFPITDGLVFKFKGGRVVFRPSGTEAKVKAYFEVKEIVMKDDVKAAEEVAERKIEELLDWVNSLFLTEEIS